MILPDSSPFTPAGRFEIEPNGNGIPRGRFVYCRRYFDDPGAVPVDPVDLDKLNDTVFRTAGFNGVFTSFRDTSPRDWGYSPQDLGCRIMKRTAARKLRDEVDYLLKSHDDRVGAPGFGPGPEPACP